MKTVRLTLRYDAETIHPMYRFVAENDSFDAYRIVHGTFVGDDDNAFIFHVVGDPDAYEAALEDTDRVSDYDLTRTGDRTFTVYVRDEPRDIDERLLEIFTRRASSCCRRSSTAPTGRCDSRSSANRPISSGRSRADPRVLRRSPIREREHRGRCR